MAFPTVPTGGRILRQTQDDTTATRTFPSLSGLTKSSGDLLIAIVVAYERAAASATFSGWTGGFTELVDVDGGATTMAVGIATKTSTGSETGTFAVTQASTVTGHVALYVMSINGWHGTTAPEVTALAVGTGAAADPAALTPSWGADDTLWIVVGASGETATGGSWTGIGGLPTNYTDPVTTGLGSDVVGGMSAFVGFRQNNTASENVGTFGAVDITNARNCALTIAVRPVSAGPSTQNIGPATGPTVTITPGTANLAADQTIAAITAPTVVITAGTATLSQTTTIAVTAPTVTVTGATATIAETGAQTITPTSPTVSITPGVPSIGQQVTASAFLGLADTAGDFDTMTTVTAALYVAEAGTRVDDSLDLYVQVFAADEATPLTDEELAYSHGGTPGVQNVTFSGVVASDKTTWDAARLRLRWSNLRVGTDDLLDVRVHAVEIGGTYAVAGALTITPSAPTVTVTPGTATVAIVAAQAITPSSPTVTITPGVPALGLRLAPTAPTVTVTPGTATVVAHQAIANISAPTVSVTPGTPTLVIGQPITPTAPTISVTPGTATVAPGPVTLAPTGPTVTVTPGVPALRLNIAPTSPTVTVTPGTPAITVAGGAQNLLPTSPTVTVTPGLPQLVYGQTVTVSSPTVTVTPGTPTVVRAQAITPTGPTVTVTPGAPRVSRGLLVTGATVTVTPGTPSISAAQALTVTGPTVSVTPGVPMFASVQGITVTAPTITITAGDPTVTRDPQGERNRFVAALDFSTDEWQPHLWPGRPVPLDPANATAGLIGAGAPHLDHHPETTLG